MRTKTFHRLVFEPLLAPLLADRRLACLLFGFGTAQAALVLAGCPGWPCPLQASIGLPCPGCGLSRGIACLLTGNWQAAIQYHLFAPVILVAMVLLGVATVLPERAHVRVVHWLKTVEHQSGVSFLLITGVFAIWALRIVAGFLPEWTIRWLP